MKENIFEVIELALAKDGYKLLDGDDETLIIRDPKNDTDYEIKVAKIVE
jgi:hypothetical protein